MPPILNTFASSSSSSSPSSLRHKANNKQRHCQQRNGNSGAAAGSRTTQSSNVTGKLLLTLMLLGLFVAAVSATDEKKSTETKTIQPAAAASPTSTISSKVVSHRDEIYIDDEGIDGSGGRGELHDDLEKDPDYSGSGFGPDDEDSSTDHHQHHRRPSIQTQSGISKQNTNDNDLSTSRTHQTNSGTIIGSGTSGNTGIISGSGNTGINTIGKDHSSTSTSTSSSSSNLPTTTNNNNNNHQQPKQQQHTTTSSLYPIQTHITPSSSNIPIHTDDDDFDLDETIGGGSGDGGIIDRDDDDDDDHTGDIDDNDNDDDIIGRDNHQIDIDAAAGGNKLHEKEHIDPYEHTSQEDRKQILGGKINKFDDDDDTLGNYDDNEDSVDQVHKTKLEHGNSNDNEDDDDEGTEIYTDVTDPNAGSNGGTAQTPDINKNQGIHELDTNNINSLPPDTTLVEHTTGNEVSIMSDDERATSFFAQPGILAAVIGGAVVGLLCAILVVMFIVYRMRKKDEGSYALDEPKRSPAVNSYAKNANNREFYA